MWNTTGPFIHLARILSRSLWDEAKARTERIQSKTPIKVYESLVFSSMDVEEAATRLSATSHSEKSDEDPVYTPLEILGCKLVKERMKNHLGALFIEAVQEKAVLADEDEDESEWRRTIDAARELSGRVEELGKMMERAWKTGVAATIEDSDLDLSSEDGMAIGTRLDAEIKALLTALVLYRRAFPEAQEGCSRSTPLSPPPSPTTKIGAKKAQILLSLRKVLGNYVFESGIGIVGAENSENRIVELEDARDVVVDMIVDLERRERGSST
jgi:hypothetical protein